MVTVTHLVSPATLPSLQSQQEQLSVLSYNVLLPNSVDAWWNYKMYSPPLSPEQHYMSSWDYRKELLRNRISLIGELVHVVCRQQ